MELLNIYKTLCNNKDWYDSYCNTGEKYNGRMFSFLSTNYRTLWTFVVGYNSFLKIENIDRREWSCYENNGEVREK